MISALFSRPFLILAVIIAVIAAASLYDVTLASLGGLLALGGMLQSDRNLYQTKALPNGAASTATDGFDLGHGARGDFLAPCELKISAPALVVGDLANGETIKYTIEHDDAAGFGTVATVEADVITQTGAGGAGAAAATKTVRLPVDVKRYVRVKATNSGAGDASDKTMTVELLF